MRTIILLVSGFIFLLWVGFILYLRGVADIPVVSQLMGSLHLPQSTNELGESLGIINGLFSGVAVVLALVAVLLQGKELKSATKAQEKQVDALLKQLKYQNISTKYNGLSLKLFYLDGEINRLSQIISDVEGNRAKENIFNSCVSKKREYVREKEELKSEMDSLVY